MRMVGKVADAEKGGRIVAAENFSNRNPPRLFRRGFAPALQAASPQPLHSPPMEPWMHALMQWLALPQFGLSTVFVVALVSATLLPVGSEPAVFGLIKLNPDLFWPAILVATVGNTIGGAISWGMGYGVHGAVHQVKPALERSASEIKALQWLEHFGPKACLLSWLPAVGDPLCAVAGWLKLPFWPCVAYMAVGKLARYITMTAGLLWVFPGVFAP